MLFRISDQGNRLAREACKVTLLTGIAAAETHSRLARGVDALTAFARRRRGGATTRQLSRVPRPDALAPAESKPLVMRVVDNDEVDAASAAADGGKDINQAGEGGTGRGGDGEAKEVEDKERGADGVVSLSQRGVGVGGADGVGRPGYPPLSEHVGLAEAGVWSQPLPRPTIAPSWGDFSSAGSVLSNGGSETTTRGDGDVQGEMRVLVSFFTFDIIVLFNLVAERGC